MANWPDSLPQEWYTDGGPSCTATDNTISTTTSVGPQKRRRRFTAQVEPVTLSGVLDEGQLADLKDFVKNTLGEVKRFTWIDFSTGEDADYRFPGGWSSVKREWRADDTWNVTLTLEMMP